MSGRRVPERRQDIDHAVARLQMVERDLRGRGLRDERVLRAMAHVPREDFVPRWMRDRAYADHPLEIGAGQTISQPYVVAATLEMARVGADDRLLDVGTGSGYGAAVASLVARDVFTVERLRELARPAQRRLSRLGYDGIVVHIGDGSIGWAAHAPFDVIVAGAAGPVIPRAWKQQLRDGGRIVAPVGDRFEQRLVRLTRDGDTYREEFLMDVRYVPLIGEQGFREREG